MAWKASVVFGSAGTQTTRTETTAGQTRDTGEETVQEANAKEVKIEGKRPAILLELQVAAPEVLRHLSLAGERTAG